MNSAVLGNKSACLTERQRNALVSLLLDDDPAVYQTIRSRILSYGTTAISWLRPYSLSDDPLTRRRVQEIVRHLSRQEADKRFIEFCRNLGEDLDVEKGALLLAQTAHPDINPTAYYALLDSYAAELQERLQDVSETEKTLAIIGQYLFSELGFLGNEQNYYDQDNSYLNRVLDRRLGSPISLCLVYLLIVRRLHLPVVGIGMPGHFLCRYQSATGEKYIDAFNRGKLLSKAECIKYLLQSGYGYMDGYLAPVSPRRILMRLSANLYQIFVDLELPSEAARLQRYILALSR